MGRKIQIKKKNAYQQHVFSWKYKKNIIFNYA